jgi:hypothetical protein
MSRLITSRLPRFGSALSGFLQRRAPRIVPILFSAFLSYLLVSCASPEKRQSVAIREATRGTAVIYFFRPELDQVDVRSRPMLAIDDQPVVTLDHQTYTAVSLTPGVHKVSLNAGPTDSANWNQSAEFKLDDGLTYFVALWHQNQPTATPSYISGLYGAVGHLIFQALHAPQGSAAARLEPVDRDVAEYGLAGLRFVAPVDGSMAVR